MTSEDRKVSIEKVARLAPHADTWYNGRVNIVVSEGATNTTQTLINLFRRFIMDTLPPHAQNSKQSSFINIISSATQKGYTQEELAKVLGKYDNFLSHVKRGTLNLYPEQIVLLESLPVKIIPSKTRWSRICPSCGKEILYPSKSRMEKRASTDSICRICFLKQGADQELTKKIVMYHAQGLGNREIADATGCHHRTVGTYLEMCNLTTNNPRGKPPVEVSPTTAICSYCGNEVLKSDFALVRSYDDGRRLNRCRDCRKKQGYARLTNDLQAYLQDKHARCRVRANKLSIPFTLPTGYLAEIYEKQRGLCFYTDMPLSAVIGNGRKPNAVSVDKVDPRGGYTPENVVICAWRINAIKMDVTPDEMRKWMPDWYRRIVAEAMIGRLLIEGINK